tara:strand:- start:1683 stop:1892 length:210 start_codon:yes stop_codon:yes gene_type:complete
MRYRSTICIDVWADSKEEAGKQVDRIVLGLPNAFQIALSRMPHGSKVSLIEENLPNSDSLISKSQGDGK